MFSRINLDKHALVEASAGTGKTYTIERLVLRLIVEKGVPLEKILVVTFTEAAASELRARIRTLLQQALDNTLEDYRKVDSPAKRAQLADQVIGFDRAAIYTIHGFCNRVLSRWPLEAGLTRGAKMVDEKALADTLIAEEMRDIWESWNLELGGRLAALIGAETKLEDLRKNVCRIAETFVPGLVELDPPPVLEISVLREILDGFAATQQAEAGTIRGNIENFLRLESAIGEFRSAAKRFNPENRHQALETIRLALVDDGVISEMKLAGALKAFGWMAADRKKNETIAGAWAAWDTIKLEVEQYQSYTRNILALLTISLGRHLRERMDGRRIDDGLISFGDMIRTVAASVAKPDSSLLVRLREQYTHAIIDEFQDTNALQWTIFRTVFMESDRHKLVVVGDPKQSIFRIQDADVYTYLEAKAAFGDKTIANIEPLKINYRAIRPLVEACNLIFKQNDWFDVEGITFESSDAAPAAKRTPDPLVEKLEALGGTMPVILRKLYDMPDIREGARGPIAASQRISYARYVLSRIMELHAEGIPYRSMALLCEKRVEVRRVLELLTEQSIPYSQYKETGLFLSDEAENWAYLLDYLADPSPEHLKNLLLTDFFAQDPGDVLEGAPVDIFGPVAQRFSELAAQGRWPQVLRAVFTRTGLLERASLRTGNKRVAAAYRQLAEWTASRLIADKMSAAEIALEIRAIRAEKRAPREEEDRFRRETEGDAVRVMTMHASKGLEFDIVFIMSGKTKASPKPPYIIRSIDGKRREQILVSLNHQRKDDQRYEDDLERQRLLYVGFTRAKYLMTVPLWTDSKDSVYDQTLRAAESTGRGLIGFDTTPTIVPLEKKSGERSAERPRVDAFQSALIQEYGDEERRLRAAARPYALPGRRRLKHSYTSLVHADGRHEEVVEDENFDESPDPADRNAGFTGFDSGVGYTMAQSTPLPKDGTTLPGSRETGIALHAILESIDFGRIGSQTLEAFCEQERESIGRVLAENNLETGATSDPYGASALIDEAGRLIWASLNLKLPLADTTSIRIADIPKRDMLTETSFTALVDRGAGLFPKADAFGTPDRVVGFVDLMFRSGNDVYLLDWKSDTLENYDRQSLLDRMQANEYTVQAALYVSVVNRWLTAQFPQSGYAAKGIHYVFLRGPSVLSIAVDSARIAEWEGALAGKFTAAAERMTLHLHGGVQ